MKLLLIALIFSFSLNADEMKRIEAIVNDITKLRSDYEGCKTEAKIYEMQLKDERDKKRVLLEEINSFKNLYKREIEYKNKILNLENKIKEQNNLLKAKVLASKNTNKEISKKPKTKEKKKNTLIIKEKIIENIVLVNCEEPNPFPKLVMKKEFVSKNKTIEKAIKVENLQELPKQKGLLAKEKIEKFKASAFRLNKDATIYDLLNGEKLYEWEKGTSFTSSIKTKNWVKITGYFVDRVWMRSSKELWIKHSDVIKR